MCNEQLAIAWFFICFALPALGQHWKVVNLSAPRSFNNVMACNNHNGYCIPVLSLSGNGATLIIVTIGGLNALNGHSVTITTNGANTDPPTLTLPITCTLNSADNITHTYACANSQAGSYTLTSPHSDGGGLICNPTLNRMQRIWRRGVKDYGGTPAGVIMIEDSSSACGIVPIAWNDSTIRTLYTDAADKSCNGTQCDYFSSSPYVVPNGDIIYTQLAVNRTTSRNTVLTSYFDHKSGLWSRLQQIPNCPDGQSSCSWACTSSYMVMANGCIGMPMKEVAGTSGGQCTSPSMYINTTCDNGRTWGAKPSTDITLVDSHAVTDEAAFCNLAGTNSYYGFVRQAVTSQVPPAGQFQLITTTDGFKTVSITNSMLRMVPPRSGTIKTEYQISPSLTCGKPTSSLDTLVYYDRYGTNANQGSMAIYFLDPKQVMASGASYLATLSPQVIWQQPFSLALPGYPDVYFYDLTHWVMQWVSEQTASDPLNNTAASDGTLKIFEMSGSLSQH
jgi:hypothetical protein